MTQQTPDLGELLEQKRRNLGVGEPVATLIGEGIGTETREATCDCGKPFTQNILVTDGKSMATPSACAECRTRKEARAAAQQDQHQRETNQIQREKAIGAAWAALAIPPKYMKWR